MLVPTNNHMLILTLLFLQEKTDAVEQEVNILHPSLFILKISGLVFLFAKITS